MNRIVKIIDYDPSRGIIEYLSGQTNAATLNMYSYCSNLAAGKAWFVGTQRLAFVATADALNAFSFSNASGACYNANILVCSWDPLLYGGMWAFSTTKSLWSATIPVTQYSGMGVTETPSISTWSSPLVIGDANPSRSATNAATATTNFIVYFGFYSK